MESRRDALKIMLATAAAAATGATTTAAEASMGAHRAARHLAERPPTTTDPAKPVASGPSTLIQPLRQGDQLGGTWQLAALHPVAAGAAVIELHDLEGQRARIHVCARQGDALGVASTPRLDLMLMNGGDGATASNEFLGRIVLGLAALVEQNEGAAFRAHPELSRLMSHDARLRAFKGSTALS